MCEIAKPEIRANFPVNINNFDKNFNWNVLDVVGANERDEVRGKNAKNEETRSVSCNKLKGLL